MLNCRATECAPGRCRLVRQTARDFFLALLIGLAVFAIAALDAGPVQSAPAASPVARSLATLDEPYAPIIRAQVKPNAKFLVPSQAAAGTDNLRAGRTASPASFSTIAIMALLFAAMSAMTLGFWRHLACAVTKPARTRKISWTTVSARGRGRQG